MLNDISKVTLGQQMGYLVERSTRMHIELEKKSKELAGIQSLVDSYNANPNFGNATNPLDVKYMLVMLLILLV